MRRGALSKSGAYVYAVSADCKDAQGESGTVEIHCGELGDREDIRMVGEALLRHEGLDADRNEVLLGAMALLDIDSEVSSASRHRRSRVMLTPPRTPLSPSFSLAESRGRLRPSLPLGVPLRARRAGPAEAGVRGGPHPIKQPGLSRGKKQKSRTAR